MLFRSDAAVAGAVKRKLGAAWAWDQTAATADISPLIAVTNALWGYQTRPIVVEQPFFARLGR